MSFITSLQELRKIAIINKEEWVKVNNYLNRFRKYSFSNECCRDNRQYEAAITRLYHTIEKGLSYEDYRAGFGKENIRKLILLMQNYVKDGYSIESKFYRNSLCVLNQYIEKNSKYNKEINGILKKEIEDLPGIPNSVGGGVIEFIPLDEERVKSVSYSDFVHSRHSMRHFSDQPVELKDIYEALEIAQCTPSACNRQGWRTIVITDKEKIKKVLAYQNGNRGFGYEIDKLLVILGDLRCMNRDRELYQVFIDGGMYAQAILCSLHYMHIATIPLSGALSNVQERHVRKTLQLRDSDEIIMFIGIGNYPEHCQTTKSTRRSPDIEIV